MSKKIFSVYDSKAAAFLPPFYVRSKGEAIRSFADEANNPGNSAIAAHPEDFTLFELGDFNEDTAEIITHPTPLSCGVAIEFVKTV